MLKRASIFFVTSMVLLFSTIASAFTVYDPTNWAQNYATAQNTYNSLQQLQKHYDLLRSSDGYLNTAQLKLTEKIGIDRINLASLSKEQLQELLGKAQNVVTPYSGAAPLNQESAFHQLYTQPTDPYQVEAQLAGILEPNQVRAMVEAARMQKMRHDLFIEGINQNKNEGDLSKRRLDAIQSYRQQVQELANTKSSLQTAQMTATELNLSLQQQEQIIKQSQEHLQYVRLQKAEEESEKAKVTKALQNKIQEVSQQSTTGLGRDRWGDL